MSSATVLQDLNEDNPEQYRLQIKNSIYGDIRQLPLVNSGSSYNTVSFRTFQAQHPQLVKVLTDMKTPSPCRVTSDKHQPKSGCLKNSMRVIPSKQSNNFAAENSWSNSKNNGLKAPIALNFKRSTILARRTQI
ncbi:unnamed protein product [Blepharisma stoltei]|uniref:Uncharacterized protein n=1 Tax=Blepharisma stoltei TaxID=1481888 RepID=A0AAU9IXC0_9CILI|nr:unnamed protein product [Blepharisma stoltei]